MYAEEKRGAPQSTTLLLKCRGLMVEKYFNLVDLVKSFPTIGVDTAETEPLKVWR